MPLLVGALALGAPRLVFALVVAFSDYIGTAFESLVPLLGFLFLPLTTLAYAWSFHTYGRVADVGLVLVIVAVLIDLGMVGGGGRAARKR